MEKQSANKQIAKNALFLYLRMSLSMIVSLYTSRVVLDVLGVTDYGIYSLVAGVVVMFTFLNASMSSATSRFLAFEIGRGEQEKINNVFSNALAVHLIIALIIGILLETIGLWLLNEKLVINEERVTAAHIVYQLSVLSTLVGITQVPYNAAIIAHERMEVYAYVELANVFLKLGIVYLLTIGNYDKLILYAILTLSVAVVIMLVYRLYCIKHFEESRLMPSMNKEIFRPMLSYAAWGVYGDGCYSIRQQGTNILLNMFFGTVVNAANGIATTVLGVVSGFSQNILTAFRPQIIKSYSIGDIKRMEQLMIYAIKYSYLMIGIMAIVFCFEMDYILALWLKEVPEYTPWICRIILISFCVVTCSFVVSAGIQATGNVRYQSFIMGSISIFGVLPCTYLCLKSGYSPYSAYICYGVFTLIMLLCFMMILKKQIPNINLFRIARNSIFSITIVLLLSSLCILLIYLYIESSFVRLLMIGVSTVLIVGFNTYVFAMNNEEKTFVRALIIKICRKFQL